MTKFTNSQIDNIAQSCINMFNKLPKTGKPIDKEWTVFSCVVLYDCDTKNHEVVSLGTGSKCLGATKMSPSGSVLNDSHAEVIARRGLLLYLYDNIHKSMENKQSIFLQQNSKFKLKENMEFVFYSSQMPCGDASIIPKTGKEEDFGDILHVKRQADSEICDLNAKRMKYDVDIYRTGAKCLPDSDQDPKRPGIEYHLLSQVRTKPGRGDRTLSVSCSDKIARWLHLGIQGSLLDMLLYEPVYVKHFIFGSEVPYSKETLTRALFTRDANSITVQLIPEFYQSSIPFPFIRKENNIRPAPGSIVWIAINNLTMEVAVQGKKLGVTKKKATNLSSSLCISKYKLYERFQQIVQNNEEIKKLLCDQEETIVNVPYNEMKRKSQRYMKHWAVVKEKFFKTWTVKPDIWNFCVT